MYSITLSFKLSNVRETEDGANQHWTPTESTLQPCTVPLCSSNYTSTFWLDFGFTLLLSFQTQMGFAFFWGVFLIFSVAKFECNNVSFWVLKCALKSKNLAFALAAWNLIINKKHLHVFNILLATTTRFLCLKSWFWLGYWGCAMWLEKPFSSNAFWVSVFLIFFNLDFVECLLVCWSKDHCWIRSVWV